MLDNKKVQILSVNYQDKVKGLFKKYNLNVLILDKDKKGRRPDFFVYHKNNREKGFICECKYIASAGVIDNGKYHVSTLDINLAKRNKGDFALDDPFAKLEEVIRNAYSQYRDLIQDKKECKFFPFVITLEMDFFANNFDFIPRNIYGLNTISAVMTIKRNIEQREEFEKWTRKELKEMINGQSRKKIPPESVRFKVLLNSCAEIKFKAEDFLRNPIIV